MNLRQNRTAPKKFLGGQGLAKRDRGKADEAELLRNLAALETKGSIATAEAEVVQTDTETDVQKEVKPLMNTMPHARFNAQLAVQDDVLYIFGGTYEHVDIEFTFDEMYVALKSVMITFHST